jgi:hypothetical protein
MSPMWDDEPEHAAGICAACGRHTDDGVVHWIARSSTADLRLIVCANLSECSSPEPAPSAGPRTGHDA